MPRIQSWARRLVAVESTTFGNVHVVDRGRRRQLIFKNSISASVQTEVVRCLALGLSHLSSVETSSVKIDVGASLRRAPYLRLITQRLLSIRPKDVLVLGLGGGLLPLALKMNGLRRVDVVEQCPIVVKFARCYFGVAEAEAEGWLHVHCTSAEKFLEESSSQGRVNKWHACVVDLFDNENMVAQSCRSPDFLSMLCRNLVSGAAVFQNYHCAADDHTAGGGIVMPAGTTRNHTRKVLRHFSEKAGEDFAGWRRSLVKQRSLPPHGPLRWMYFARGGGIEREAIEVERAYHLSFCSYRKMVPCSWLCNGVLEAYM